MVPRSALRRRVVGGLGALLLHRARRATGASTRSGGTGSARRSTTTCWCWRSPTSSSSSTCAPRRTGDLVVLWSESRDTSEVWVARRRTTRRSRAAVGRRAPARGRVPRRAPAGPRRLGRAAAGHQRRRDRVPAGAAARSRATATRTPRPGRRCGPRTRPSGWSGSRRSPATSCSVSRAGGAQPLRILPLDDLDRRRASWSRPVSDIASLVAPARERRATTSTAIIVVDESYLMPPVWSDARPPTGERTELLRKDAPGFDPAAYVGEQRSFPSVDGTRGPGDDPAAPRHPAGRHGAGVMYAYGAYESVFPTRSGTRRSRACSTAASSTCTRTSAAVARAAGAGGSTAGWSTSSTPSTTTSRSPTGWPRRAWSTAPGSPPAGSRAGGLLQGAVFSPAADRWRAVVAEVPFVDVVTTMLDPTIPLTVNEWDEWGDPSRPEDYAWMARLLAVRQPAAGGRPPRPAGHRRRPRRRG